MQIPDSPEELFELLSDQSVKVVFPQYDNLPLMHQKMLRILHAELTKGELSDKSLRDSLLFIVTVWRTLNQRIADHMRYMINDAEEVDTDWFDDYSHFGRMDNYLAIIYQVVEMLPALAPEDDPSSTITGRYSLRGPGD